MRGNAFRRMILIVLAVGVSACGARSGETAVSGEAEPATVLEVDNQATLDMTIYVVRSSGARERLGMATAHTRTRLRIPPRLIFGLTPLRFMADPIGGSATPVTQEITVQPGDTVVLQIPPR
jgi:hypothetical protein